MPVDTTNSRARVFALSRDDELDGAELPQGIAVRPFVAALMTGQHGRVLGAAIALAVIAGVCFVTPSTANREFAFLERFRPHTLFDKHEADGYRHLLLSFDGSRSQAIRVEMCRSLPRYGWKKSWESEELDLQFTRRGFRDSVDFGMDPNDLSELARDKRIRPHCLVDIYYRESWAERLAYRITTLFKFGSG